jgi:hypothetical protein
MAAPNTKKIVLSSGFPAIKTDFFRQSTIDGGQKLVNADHVFRVTEEKVAGVSTIYGSCVPQTNVRKIPYRIELRLDVNRNVCGGNCTCVAGAGVTCKHSAALVFFINSERDESKTAKACEWAKPSQKKLNLYPKGRSVDDIIKNSRPVSPPTFGPLSDEAKAELLAFHMEVDETDSMMFKTLTATVSNLSFKYSPNATLRSAISWKNLTKKYLTKKHLKYFFKKKFRDFFLHFLGLSVIPSQFGVCLQTFWGSRPAGLGGDRDCTNST